MRSQAKTLLRVVERVESVGVQVSRPAQRLSVAGVASYVNMRDESRFLEPGETAFERRHRKWDANVFGWSHTFPVGEPPQRPEPHSTSQQPRILIPPSLG